MTKTELKILTTLGRAGYVLVYPNTVEKRIAYRLAEVMDLIEREQLDQDGKVCYTYRLTDEAISNHTLKFNKSASLSAWNA